jgi:putative hydrolase of the HAD superfamily
MKQYKAIFFDLDHTLWDFDRNSHETISELFIAHGLKLQGINCHESFISVYREINSGMWDAYHRNQINKEQLRSGRFNKALQKFNVVNDELAETLSSEYLRICPLKKHLLPGTMEVLNILKAKYSLHIITNGFKEVQHLKLKHSGIDNYFQHIHISEVIGFKKPEAEIFHHAVSKAQTVHENCLMVGDNLLTDIAGAENAGIDAVYFNPCKLKSESKIRCEINHLEQLLHFL